MHMYQTSFDSGHRHQVHVPRPPAGARELALQTTYDDGHRHGVTLPAGRLRRGQRIEKYTTYDQGHRHTVTVPGTAGLRGLGAEMPPLPVPSELPGGYLSPEACAQRVAETQQAERADGKKTAYTYGIAGAAIGIAVGLFAGKKLL